MTDLPQSTIEAMARRRRAGYVVKLPEPVEVSTGISEYWISEATKDLEAALKEGSIMLASDHRKEIERWERRWDHANDIVCRCNSLEG